MHFYTVNMLRLLQQFLGGEVTCSRMWCATRAECPPATPRKGSAYERRVALAIIAIYRAGVNLGVQRLGGGGIRVQPYSLLGHAGETADQEQRVSSACSITLTSSAVITTGVPEECIEIKNLFSHPDSCPEARGRALLELGLCCLLAWSDHWGNSEIGCC